MGSLSPKDYQHRKVSAITNMTKNQQLLSVVILDNDKTISRNLQKFIENSSHVIGSLNVYHDPLSAIRSLRENIPDLLFLNIDSRELNGLDVLRLLPPGVEQTVVYITDHDKIGVEALRLGAREYLLSPVKESEVKMIIDNLVARKRVETQNRRATFNDKLLINKQDRAVIINIDEILYIEAEGPYSNFFLVDKTTVKSSKSLGYYLKLLADKRNLIKINRSYVVNFDHIKEVVKDGSGEGILVLSNQQRVEFSNNSKSRLLQGIQEIINNSIRG